MRNNQPVTFTQQQLRYIESLFPTIVFGPQSTHQVMMHYNGQQSVVEAIRKVTRGPSGQHEIPMPR